VVGEEGHNEVQETGQDQEGTPIDVCAFHTIQLARFGPLSFAANLRTTTRNLDAVALSLMRYQAFVLPNVVLTMFLVPIRRR
jgi:hypothetical protein